MHYLRYDISSNFPVIPVRRRPDPAIHRTVEYANYLLKDMSGVLAASYYWGEMDRFEAERLLEGKPEGETLVELDDVVLVLRVLVGNVYLFTVHLT